MLCASLCVIVIIRSGADAQIGSQDTREGWFIDGIHRDPKLYSIKRFCNRVPVLFVLAGTVIDGGRMDVMEDVFSTFLHSSNCCLELGSALFHDTASLLS